nr:MotA/TolQ/ExbB proton channel family protein [Shewanella intestini]
MPFSTLALPDWLFDGGPILWIIFVFAAILYWQLADLLGQLQCSGSHSCWLCRHHKCEQLVAWVSAAPLLGLLGTVHGLLNSFEVLATEHSTSISQGIAQALITTEVGLIVAIPAWILLLLGQQRCQSKLEQSQ